MRRHRNLRDLRARAWEQRAHEISKSVHVNARGCAFESSTYFSKSSLVMSEQSSKSCEPDFPLDSRDCAGIPDCECSLRMLELERVAEKESKGAVSKKALSSSNRWL